MTRDGAYQTLTVYTQSPNLIRHHLAVEKVMRAIAEYITKNRNIYIDAEKWAVTGLLHDADYELTRKTPERHTLYLEEKMGNEIPPDIMYAIKAHNYAYTQIEPKSLMDWALYTCDELTGFIVECTLKFGDKKIDNITAEQIIEKLNDEIFETSVNRRQITLCEQTLGIPLADFVKITLTAMQSIDSELNLA